MGEDGVGSDAVLPGMGGFLRSVRTPEFAGMVFHEVEARSALIDSLIESLDATVDEGATEAWKREIALRLKQIDDGTVELISWSAARRRLRDQLEL